jgi:hypothetical protein
LEILERLDIDDFKKRKEKDTIQSEGKEGRLKKLGFRSLYKQLETNKMWT